MNSENPSVEELLRSLRETVEARNKANYAPYSAQNDVLDLVNPLSNGVNQDMSVMQFVQEAVEKAVFKIMQQNEKMVFDSVDRALSSSSAKNMLADLCNDYFEAHTNFEPIIRDIIEKRIAQIIRA